MLPDCYPFAPPRCLSNACRNAWSTRHAASSCIPGRTCEYRSKVIATVACPSRSCAIFGWMPLAKNCVAWLCRRSWKRTFGRSVLAMNRTNSCVRLFGFSGCPSAWATTYMSSDCRRPSRRSSSACRILCRRNSSTASAVSDTVRARPLLGSFSRIPALVCSVLLITASCAAFDKSTLR